MIETLKKHPWLMGGTAIVAVLAIVYLNSGSGSSGSVPGGNTADVQAAENLQGLQLQAQSQAAGYSAAANAQAEQDATQLALAKIQYGVQGDANDLAAQIASQQISAEQQLGSLQSTLSYKANADTLNAQTQQLAITTNANLQQTQFITNALVEQSKIQADVAKTGIITSGQVYSKAIDASCGFFCKLFG
jgi:hypothetical protein